ncbi:MAG: VWA domain-containing protein [Acidobacteria bacterium]|nr:VWA domain-containing protein [Acidobacteriota bacterium]MBI3422943.1 VWA domain-containing protein [Acidobacteriota bacterium]
MPPAVIKMCNPAFRVFFLSLVCLLATAPLAAQTRDKQDKQRPPEPDPGSTISIDTLEVLLPVTVRDRTSGQFVTDLKADDFLVYEDGQPQPISSFALKRLPVHVVLLVDTSSSAAHELESFRTVAYNFISQLDPADQISLISFHDKVELIQDWTANRLLLKRALNRLQSGMFTRFNEALWLAANEQLDKIKGRKAIIVLTDGIDSGFGRITNERAFRALQEAEVATYVVSKTRLDANKEREDLEFYQREGNNSLNKIRLDGIKLHLKTLSESEQNLTHIAEETGGRIFLPEQFDDLGAAYQQVAEELRSQYVIFYSPTRAERDGKYRAIRVKVKRPNCQTATRFGYYPK